MELLAIIGGSGLNELPGLRVYQQVVLESPYGECSAALLLGDLAGRSLAFLPRHGHPHRIPPHKVNYRANIWALKQQGVQAILAVNAVGGITDGMDAGVICIPDQIIDYTNGRDHTFSDSPAVALRHVDFSEPYDSSLRQQLLKAAHSSSTACVDGGVMGVTQGPRLETAAEIGRMEADGCDMVGMTAMPEAALARELDIPYVSVAVVVNRAAGKQDGPITMDDINAVMTGSMARVHELIVAFMNASQQ